MSTLQQLRDWEAAKIARWFAETEYGLVYVDRAGRALPVSEGHRARWLRQAMRQLDRYVARYRRAPFEMLAIVVALTAATSAATALLGDRIAILGQLHPAWPLAAAALSLLHADWRFRRDQRALRREIAGRLAFRTPLPRAAAATARRYNVFAIGQKAAALAIMAVAGLAIWRDALLPGFLAILVLVAIGWPLSWAAKRVDAAHRRPLQ